MSKVLTIAATVVGIAALVLTGVGIIVGPAAMIGITAALGGVTASMLGAAAGILSIGASLLASKPKSPDLSQASLDRLNVSLDPRTSRKAVFGTTALAVDLRDHETNKAAGTVDNYWVDRFLVHAAHKITSIDEIWFDDEKVWSGGAVVSGSAAKGFLTVDTRLEGNAANAINVSARLGSSRRFTGCAYTRFRYQISSKSPYMSSIPTRITVRGKGMPVYDPRKDSTVPGGSGTQRADDQSTWAFNVSSNGQGDNPALQMLTWLLGWKIQNPVTLAWKLSVGRGLPKDRFNMPSFIAAANACDELVAKKGGGTEKRYRAAGIVGENEDPISVVDRFKAAMNATLDDVDGQIRIQILVNDLGSPVASFTEKDVLDDFQWKPFENLTNTANVMRGQYVDASDKALYQLLDYPDVTVPSRDGIDRIDQCSFDMVQSSSQAQRLAKQRLQRAQYPGFFQATFQCTAWRAQKGDVIELSFGPCGFVDRLFRVVEMEYREDGKVPVTLREENAAIYAWDSTEEGDVNLADPTAFSILDDPWYQIITGNWRPPAFYAPDGNMMVDAQFGVLWDISQIYGKRVDSAPTATFPFAPQMPYAAEVELGHPLATRLTNLEAFAAVPGRVYWQRIRIARATTATIGVGTTVSLRAQFFDIDDNILATVDSFFPLGSLSPSGSYSTFVVSRQAPDLTARVEFSSAVTAPTGSGFIRLADPWLSDKQPGADVTLSLGVGPVDLTINYNSDGTIVPGQLPLDLKYGVFGGGLRLTENLGGTWIVTDGSVNGADPSSGPTALVPDISDDSLFFTLTSLEATSQVQINATANGRAVPPFLLPIKKAIAAPSPGTGGGGGGGGTGSSFTFNGPFGSPVNSTTYADIGGGLHPVTVGSGQTKVTLSVNIAYKRYQEVASDSDLTIKFQRETSPGSYTDVGSPVTKTIASRFIDTDELFGWRFPAPVFAFSFDDTLSPGTYKYRLVAAIGSGDLEVIWTGGTDHKFSGVPS